MLHLPRLLYYMALHAEGERTAVRFLVYTKLRDQLLTGKTDCVRSHQQPWRLKLKQTPSQTRVKKADGVNVEEVRGVRSGKVSQVSNQHFSEMSVQSPYLIPEQVLRLPATLRKKWLSWMLTQDCYLFCNMQCTVWEFGKQDGKKKCVLIPS